MFRSFKSNNETPGNYSKDDSIKIVIDSNKDEIINELHQTALFRYQQFPGKIER